jgi:hypothetical protein
MRDPNCATGGGLIARCIEHAISFGADGKLRIPPDNPSLLIPAIRRTLAMGARRVRRNRELTSNFSHLTINSPTKLIYLG